MPEPERLQKYLARAGVASRRASEKIILAGRVSINGVVVSELGTKVDPGIDRVLVDGIEVTPADDSVTFMLNKPVGYVTTMFDPQGRPCVADLMPLTEFPSLYPIGRLDRNTSGLLLFSTDGELGHGLLHPSHHVDKTYKATVEGIPTDEALNTLRCGVELDDGITQPAVVEVKQSITRRIRGKNLPFTILEITIHEGRNRQIRRMCKAVGNPVADLHRSTFANLTLGNLEEGNYRKLTSAELAALKSACGLA